jgi:hypothetical protein
MVLTKERMRICIRSADKDKDRDRLNDGVRMLDNRWPLP